MSERLRIGIVMGSDSDLKTMRRVGDALSMLGLFSNVDYEERVKSAHRTPDAMMQYAAEAEDRGLKIIVAGAGGSAHLPGMVASKTILPVLGVAITSSPDTLNRPLGSMIGMPEGAPLATFQGEAGAFDAGLWVARILIKFEDEPELRQAYLDYEEEMREIVAEKDAMLMHLGADHYPMDTLGAK